MAHCLVNLSELRYLQDRIGLALSAWKEAYRLISSLYLQTPGVAVMKGEGEGGGVTKAAGNGSLPLVPFGPGVLMKLESLVRRMVRLSFLLNPPQLLSKVMLPKPFSCTLPSTVHSLPHFSLALFSVSAPAPGLFVVLCCSSFVLKLLCL